VIDTGTTSAEPADPGQALSPLTEPPGARRTVPHRGLPSRVSMGAA
jgi:hypothetical protein